MTEVLLKFCQSRSLQGYVELFGAKLSFSKIKFDNSTIHSLGVMEIQGKDTTLHGHLKYLDPDGDFVIFRYRRNPGEKAATTTLLNGTGKWKGITGSGKAMRIATGKPIVEGTAQFCNNHKGTFTLPE